MAGIAVLFEQPFQVGDWITVGSITGEVMEMNWRSVRVRTRARDLVVVPNSVIGKETLINLSRPTRTHGETHTLGFSYDDPPNKVKRVLSRVVLSTRGVLADPPPAIAPSITPRTRSSIRSGSSSTTTRGRWRSTTSS
jgi:small-conductance mechanosensitive channel